MTSGNGRESPLARILRLARIREAKDAQREAKERRDEVERQRQRRVRARRRREGQ